MSEHYAYRPGHRDDADICPTCTTWQQTDVPWPCPVEVTRRLRAVVDNPEQHGWWCHIPRGLDDDCCCDLQPFKSLLERP